MLSTKFDLVGEPEPEKIDNCVCCGSHHVELLGRGICVVDVGASNAIDDISDS